MRKLTINHAGKLAATELRRAILMGTLRPGQRLRQEELAERLGVSRMPVRQALAELVQGGLVEVDRSRGAIVSRLSAGYIRDIYRFREVIERYVASTLADQGFDTSKLREVVTAGRAAATSGEVSRALDLDLRLHTKLCEAVGNAVVTEVMHKQWDHIHRVMFMGVFVGPSGFRSHVWDEHAAILDAIDDKDAERAGSVAAYHIRNASVIALENVELVNAQERGEDDGAAVSGAASLTGGSSTGN